ncbi:hypothetical protein M0G43_08310 [Subsaxibacter sp. CAU 1640]|uniref:hypothetical protein n=1 Tax=Subsaxibacter sp. CAU 1640 TaxID=2933271 RepID=UPI002006D16C|nr:hypothetical protein [Subsaxibacter sp. CAU 1640]MCK7590572.1 hypothetical protein [Subsaxibacter sp. CAU 1640]
MQNKALDKETSRRLNVEFDSRKLSDDELKRLEQKYQMNQSGFKSEIEKPTWNPIFTAFAINRHFRHLALLKTQGKRDEAESYMAKLYLGLAIWFGFIIWLLLLLNRQFYL